MENSNVERRRVAAAICFGGGALSELSTPMAAAGE